ncbi:hypothetical protein Pan181_06420 [Aeoliella mucimassa]|uniref:Plasmid stabilization system protein n=2 Tax=Aeoliella mucimassa TaxID=2527972 RepID=A0A518AID0_9BACT|nr:hypothetical protein Pan181_06420 [Aeoliella mucimassa]
MQNALGETLSQIERSPYLGEQYDHPKLHNVRRVLVNRYSNYSLYYQVNESSILVIRAIHNARQIDSALATPP